MACLQTLKTLEAKSRSFWDDIELFRAGVDHDREKYFATFAFPYMNGTLHLGHAYTLSKAEFSSAYQRLKGVNVLFPQGFHASGTPIPACAQKVAEQDLNQITALREMGVDKDEIGLFSDPKHWINTFVPKTIDVMKTLSCGIDWRRTFITTDVSPQYDSFVRWQFTKLERLGLLKKGKKIIIYSVQDRQPCSDHDRSQGEGIKPVKVILEQAVNPSGDVVWYKKKQSQEVRPRFVRCRSKDHSVEMRVAADLTASFFHQEIISEIGEETTDGMFFREVWKPSNLEYWEPQSKVISRSGETCIVAKISQWYIDYEDRVWRNKAFEALSSLNVFNADVKIKLEAAMAELQAWGCSRSRGLGTKLPCDPEYVIDSLSDSTLYMAFYTIAHRVNSMQPLSFDVWDSVFCGSSLPSDCPLDTRFIQDLREEFLYWYPMDLRVSGKDLIGNHLVFSLFNHAGLLPSLIPKAYWCNGHLLLNGKKMAKSTGNFMTLEQALDRWGADAVRLTLAEAGDKLDDANFDVQQAESAVLRLTSELNWLHEQQADQNQLRSGPYVFADRLFIDDINRAITSTEKGYDTLRFREVVLNGWYALLGARDEYRDLLKNLMPLHSDCINMWVQTLTKLMAPIIPHFCEHVHRDILEETDSVLTSGFPHPSDSTPLAHGHELRYVRGIIKQVKRTLALQSGAADSKVSITVSAPLSGWKKDLAQDVRQGVTCSLDLALKYVRNHDQARSKSIVIPFYKYISRQPDNCLLAEGDLLHTNAHTILQFTGLEPHQLHIEESDRVLYGKPKVRLICTISTT